MLAKRYQRLGLRLHAQWGSGSLGPASCVVAVQAQIGRPWRPWSVLGAKVLEILQKYPACNHALWHALYVRQELGRALSPSQEPLEVASQRPLPLE